MGAGPGVTLLGATLQVITLITLSWVIIISYPPGSPSQSQISRSQSLARL